MKTLLCMLSLMSLIGCSHTPDPVQGSTGFVVAEAPSWEAWTNDMPMAARSLHVSGEVTVSNGRYTAQLKPSNDTSKPGIHCQLVVVDNGGLGTTALTSRKVHFIDSDYNGTDEQVIVHFPDDTTLELPIESAQ